MAQNVTINGVTYQNVPEVNIPKVGGGTAKFIDPSDATLDAAGKLLNGVTAIGANGVKYTGSLTVPTVSQDSTTKVLTIQ